MQTSFSFVYDEAVIAKNAQFLEQDGNILRPLTTIVKDAQLPVEWVACEPGGIDRQLLLDQSSPILMYDDVVLFEDFIHDHGVVRISVKTRIMPRCWYVLLRYWLRVDGVVMKVCTFVCSYLEHSKSVCLTLVHQQDKPARIDLAMALHLSRALLTGLRHALLSQVRRKYCVSRAHTALCDVR